MGARRFRFSGGAIAVSAAVAVPPATVSGAERSVPSGPVTTGPRAAAGPGGRIVTLVSGDRVVDGSPKGAFRVVAATGREGMPAAGGGSTVEQTIIRAYGLTAAPAQGAD